MLATLDAATTGLASNELHGGGNERVRTELMALTGYFHTERATTPASTGRRLARTRSSSPSTYPNVGHTTKSARPIPPTTTWTSP